MAKKNTGTRFAEVKADTVKRKKIYVRCPEGADIYSICPNTIRKLAREAKAVRKVHGTCLINTIVLSGYIEQMYGEGGPYGV